MTERGLQVAYRRGQVLGAYLTIAHPTGQKAREPKRQWTASSSRILGSTGLIVSVITVAFTGTWFSSGSAQSTVVRPPVIDVHVHSTNTSPQDALARMKSLNIRYLFVSSLASDLPLWAAALGPDQFMPALVLPCDSGRAPISGRPCWDGSGDLPDVNWLRGEFRAGRLKALGEVSPQYEGMWPGDNRLEPYWALAEEFDVPVAIHMGPGPPGAAYPSSPVPFKSPAFSMAAGDPMLLEEVLLKHKRLRLLVMHAGWPRLESMLALLYAHPGVHVDVAALQNPGMVPRPAYSHYLQALIDNGFGKRVMFGSDFPNLEESGIAAITGADFLSVEQKSDILCRNAARFFRLSADLCQP